MLCNETRDHDAARLRVALETGGDVHAVAIDVVILDNDVSDVEAHAECDALVGRPLASRAVTARCICMAACMALLALANTAMNPSPVFLATPPWCRAMIGSISEYRKSMRRICVPRSSDSINRV